MEHFDKYRSKEFRKNQWLTEIKNSPLEWLFNFILKIEPIGKRWRKNRGQDDALDMAPLLKSIKTLEYVADLGCGQGDILRSVIDYLKEIRSQANIRGIGIDKVTDISSKVLGHDIAFCRGDATKTELPDHSVDLVLACYILQVLDEDAQELLFEEIRRLLAPGGTVIFLEVIDRGDQKQNDKNRLKHIFLNQGAPYLIKTPAGWIEYIEAHKFRVASHTIVGKRSQAYSAYPI